MKTRIRIVAFILMIANVAFSQFNNGNYFEFTQWLDSDGNHINAHHGGILYHQGTYWWYGQDHRPGAGGSATTVGVSLYSAKNAI